MTGAGEWTGRLSERVVLQTPIDSPDGAGGRLRAWRDAATLWAWVTPLPPQARERADRRELPGRFRILLRARTDITPEARLLWRGRTLSVLRLRDPDGRRARLEIEAEEAA